jgi:death-on-curing protein
VTDDAPLTAEQIHWIHEQVVSAYDLAHDGTRHPSTDGVLDRLVTDAAEFDDPCRQGGTVLRRLITAHVYVDGNKRTAWVAAIKILDTADERDAVKREEAPDVLRNVSRFDVDELTAWLRDGEIDLPKLRAPD